MLSILMPVYNEVERVEQAIEEVLAVELPIPFELIIIDDGSTDGTSELLERVSHPDHVRVLRQEPNRGKGAAVRHGLAHARGELTGIMDADLEYEPADLAELVRPLLAGETDAVFGVRAFDGYTSHSFLFVLGNRAVTFVANALFNVYFGDLMACHKVIRTDVFRSLDLRADGFEIEPEIAARLVQRGVRVFEMPVRYKARGSEEGKKLTARDGLRVVRMLLRCRFSR